MFLQDGKGMRFGRGENNRWEMTGNFKRKMDLEVACFTCGYGPNMLKCRLLGVLGLKEFITIVSRFFRKFNFAVW